MSVNSELLSGEDQDFGVGHPTVVLGNAEKFSCWIVSLHS